MTATHTGALPEGADFPNIEFRSDVTVELVRSSAHDSDVLFAARVSTKGEQSLEDVEADAERSKGLINFLMRSRHGCYDDNTEVLTSHGWVPWPQVTGKERFVTLSPDGRIVYQYAQRLVRRVHHGPMVRVKTCHVDLLVTPEHRMWAKRRRQPHREQWSLVPAIDLFSACHRLALGGGRWSAEFPLTFPPAWFSLLGLFIGNGNSVGYGAPTFHLRKSREIGALYQWAGELGFNVQRTKDRFFVAADEDFRLFAKKCYDIDRQKIIPGEILECSAEALRALLAGLMASDGSVSESGKQVYTTTSQRLADQIQEVALKTGTTARIKTRYTHDLGHYGTKPVHIATIFRSRNLLPRIGWTITNRKREVTIEDYRGEVHCVTVPNGTLYVRRNGKALWSGNSPFEHNSMTFYVHAPIFVFREHMRHRIASYNEESGRYRELRPVFYVPGADRKLVQEGKPGHYTFVAGSAEQHGLVDAETRKVCTEAYAAYRRMLAAGIAREVARIVLPLTIYSSMYVTFNARSLMNFLSLRTRRDDAAFPSFPQREIEMVAEQMEAHWARLMPLTHAAFEGNGRIAP